MHESTSDTGKHRVTLGLGDKVLAAIAVAAAIGVPSYLWKRQDSQQQAWQERMDRTLQAVDTRTQVIVAMTADVPAVRDRGIKNEVNIATLQRDVQELKTMQGLK